MQKSSESPLDQREFQNILLWMPNWVGDVVLSLPAIQALHSKFADARVTAVIKPPTHELIRGHPAIDSVIKISNGEKPGFLEQVQFARDLRGYNFDLGIVLPNSFRSAFMLYLSGAQTRLGYNTEGRSFLLTHPIKVSHDSATEHRVHYFFNILSSLGITDLPTRFQFPIPQEVTDSVSDHFSRLGIDERAFCVSIHPGGSKFPRTWHAERFGILCQKLIKEYGAKIILLGTAQDVDINKKIANFCPKNSIFNLPALKLKETATVIKRSKLFVGNDSGMMHLAAMVETPIVGIFGPGNPVTTGPYIDPRRLVVVSRNYSCSPCRQKFFKECRPSPHNKPYCIEDISVKDTMEAVKKILVDNLLK